MRPVHVDAEGPQEHLCTPAVPLLPSLQSVAVAKEEESNTRVVEGEENRVEKFQHSPLLPEYLADLQHASMTVDDSHKPTPENIPGVVPVLTVFQNGRSEGWISSYGSGNRTHAESACRLFSNADFSRRIYLQQVFVLFPLHYLEDTVMTDMATG